jgi:dethiobiotin synthetase
MAEAAPFSCFVTGTDTGVGKTLIAAALLRAQAASGLRVCGMKPVAAGAQWRDGAWHNEDVDAISGAGSVTVPRELTCPYLFEHALAPHLAAELAGVSMDPARILRAYEDLRGRCDAVVVEGVGGFRVPLLPGFDTAELARRMALPVVLVVGLRLGCLNHAALTAEAIAARGLRLAAWVANRIEPGMALPQENLRALETLLAAPCLGCVPHLASPDAEAARAWLDMGRLVY